jgi:hypothetical protein
VLIVMLTGRLGSLEREVLASQGEDLSRKKAA